METFSVKLTEDECKQVIRVRIFNKLGSEDLIHYLIDWQSVLNTVCEKGLDAAVNELWNDVQNMEEARKQKKYEIFDFNRNIMPRV